MQKSKEKQVKTYKGTFISNQRMKRAGGRIKCLEFKNKIQVMGRNQAIHQSEVEWTQVRRYKRDKKPNRNQSRKDQNNKQSQIKNEKVTAKPQTNSKYKQKQQIKEQKQVKKNISKQVELKKTQKSQLENEGIKANKNNNKKKYKVKQIQQSDKDIKSVSENSETKVENQSQNIEQGQNLNAKNDNSIKLQSQQVTKENKQTINDRDNEQQTRKQGQNDASSDESSLQDLQIIVAKIKEQTKIKFKTKPFVGILYFEKRKNFKKSRDILENPIEQIMSDYYADLKPIHARLPIMQLDDLNVQNYKILYDYAQKMVKEDKKQSKKKYLNNILDELSSVYILMTFSEWDGDIPLANIHKIIGKAMTIDGQCERFLYEHGLNDFHYDEIKLEQIPINPTQKHKEVKQMVFTIDPPTSTDLDDALSIQKISENLFNVGIHIADVTSYLHLIDREQISRRTTSVYLPYKAYHMLNRNLVKICSLDPGVERLAFTIWVAMDIQGNVVGESIIEKSIIKSRFKLSYGVVQDLISGVTGFKQFNQINPCSEAQFQQLLEKLLYMVDIAVAHRNKRIIFDVFENREMEFKLDQNRWPVECYVDKRYTAKKMVEEFMIIGNIESARFIIKTNPNNALVIHHPKPNKLAVTQFNEHFKSLDSKFKFQNVLDVQKQLLKVNESEIKQQTKDMLFFKARRVMEPAIYRKYGEIISEAKQKEKQNEKEGLKKRQTDQFPIIHFALGLQFYTHFTSPMRRMADIVVHETLTQIITGQEVTDISTEQITKINEGRRSTKRLKKDLNEVYLCLMIHHTKKSIQCEGIIASFGLQSVSIFIPIFDTQKQVLWKKEFKIHSIKRIRNKQNQLDVKLYHDPKTAKKDVYWVIERFQKVNLTLDCTKSPPLKLIITMKVQSEKGPYIINWIQEQ